MMRRANEGKPASSPSSPHLNCDVGLGLRMHPYSCDGGGVTGTGSSNTHGGVPLPRTNFRASGKSVLSGSQWEELERQKMIHKYIMASIPVPPHLLSPSNSNTRYSSDAEPWRCKRTDGKKWRCSRDVAPDQKYCDRHAHKSKPRSRKPVEPSPHSNHFLPLQTHQSAESRCIEWFIRDAASNSSSGLKSDNLGGSDPWQPSNSKFGCLETKSLIDGWDNNTKVTPNSLSLSIPGIDDNQECCGMMMMNPGGPLGEALCLGRGVASPHHRSSKSSGQEDSHALNFIG